MISPCEKVCILDRAKEICSVCGRTTWEIANWSGMTHSQRKEIIKRLKSRDNKK